MTNLWRSIRRLARWIRRCYSWNVFFWSADIEEWDRDGLWRTMAHAITRHADITESRAFYVNYERDVRNMRVAAKLLERLADDEYIEDDWDKHITKYWDNDNGFLTRFKGKQDEKEVRSFKRMRDKEMSLRKQDMELFCHIFKTQSRKWWS